jgi:hypothetical protein
VHGTLSVFKTHDVERFSWECSHASLLSPLKAVNWVVDRKQLNRQLLLSEWQENALLNDRMDDQVRGGDQDSLSC